MPTPKGLPNFAAFWPYYLAEHRWPYVRGMHYVGTVACTLLLAYLSYTKQWSYFWGVVGYWGFGDSPIVPGASNTCLTTLTVLGVWFFVDGDSLVFQRCRCDDLRPQIETHTLAEDVLCLGSVQLIFRLVLP